MLIYRWMRKPSDKILWFTAFVFGLGLTNYQVLLFAIVPLALIIAPYFLHFSYGIYGVLVPLCFFLFQKYRGIDALAFSALTYGKYLYDGNLTQVYAIAASIPILLYNGKRGAFSLKYFFYIIYPAHLLLLYAIHYILVNHRFPF